MAHVTVLKPAFYDDFRCIGVVCEDCCCQGWSVSVDRASYEKYQLVSDDELGSKLRQLITIKNAESESGYGVIQLAGDQCSFLSEGLCDIQRKLGEEYLCRTCASYPRLVNRREDIEERSLELSCPEAARLTLMNAGPIELGELDGWVRKLVMGLLQNRNYPVAKRLILVGHVCDNWSELESLHASVEERRRFLEVFALAVDGRLYDEHLEQCRADPARQLRLALDLMVARVEMDYTPPRYLELYREFVDGLELMPGESPEVYGARYGEAYRKYYSPFMERHEYMLEQYLVSYAFKTMFPFGLAPVNRLLNLPQVEGTYVAQYLLMVSYFSISKALMIGLAAKYREEFGTEHVVRCVQSISRTLEHCGPYARRVLEILCSKGIRNAAGMVVLSQN